MVPSRFRFLTSSPQRDSTIAGESAQYHPTWLAARGGSTPLRPTLVDYLELGEQRVDRCDDRRNDSQCDVGFDRPLSAGLALLFVRHRARGPSRGADRAVGVRVLGLQSI